MGGVAYHYLTGTIGKPERFGVPPHEDQIHRDTGQCDKSPNAAVHRRGIDGHDHNEQSADNEDDGKNDRHLARETESRNKDYKDYNIHIIIALTLIVWLPKPICGVYE